MADQAEAVVDATVVDEHPPAIQAPSVQVVPAAVASVAPQVEAEELGKRLAVIKTVMETEMIEGVDYGKIPGTDKPALLKPGAEKLNVLFQLDVQVVNTKMWGPGDHLTVESKATVFHAPTGQRLGSGEGMCSTREKKYGKRSQKRECPECHEHTIFESKPREDRPAEFYCWRKKGGCGASFAINDPKITSQVEGEIENPDLPDTYNTVVKMASKRARVDAILTVTGASALFTQDEDTKAQQEPPEPTAPWCGKPASDKTRSHASQAMLKLCGQDAELAERTWNQIVGFMDNTMPESVALTIWKLSQVTEAAYREQPAKLVEVDPTDDPLDGISTDRLEDMALSAWERLEGSDKAIRRVQAAQNNPRRLKGLIRAANKAMEQDAAHAAGVAA